MMRPVGLLAALLSLTASTAYASDLAYVGRADETAAKAAETVRMRAPGFDRAVPFNNVAAVADAVSTGRAEEGLIPAINDDGVLAPTANLLLARADFGLRIVGETRAGEPDAGPIIYWVLAKPLEHLTETHPDRLILTLDAPEGSKTFSFVVAGLSKLGFTVTCATGAPLPGNALGFRYLLALAADKPVLVLRVTDAIARDSRAGGGHALMIGAWRQAIG
jgi:hypothetical protein